MTALGVTLAYTLPPVYNAQARLLVESPQIPDELAASTVQTEAPEMLRIIQQRILTRSNLLEISRKYNIHADRPDMTADDIVADMRTRTIIGLPNARDTTGLVTISFAAPPGAAFGRGDQRIRHPDAPAERRAAHRRGQPDARFLRAGGRAPE